MVCACPLTIIDHNISFYFRTNYRLAELVFELAIKVNGHVILS